jgi:dihydropyrimidine dehydrogenase (NAD+) subunit PreA
MADLGADPALKDAHLSGMGGIETWRDAVEFLLLGAGSLQVTTAVMQYGYRIIDDLLSGLRIYMAQRGYDRISQMVGAAVENVVDLDDLERDTIVYPRFRRDRCVGCGRCYLSCRDGGHQALRFDEERRQPVLIPQNCVGCHLCLLVCPQNAIGNSRKRMQPKK